MKKLAAILVLALTTSCSAQEKKCSDFKIGSFIYSDPLYANLKVIRTDSTQIEIDVKSGFEMQSSIKWIDDCNYLLTTTKVLNADLEKALGKTIEVEIVETKFDSYTLRSNSENGNLELEMQRID